ncbi:hypothetical protein Smp_102490 [Schistosoma mansoni]|uniref:39S ribosomal protein L30, mitochondrial n=1 Tax=Schistosoma mansoni TaxID=6183 RepID=A0A3Q0KJV4_SCHMA|nr:hypothetical protein Smp_102490 [Schistosoma mansoni]|eukprot:XP_018649808.1 hypothetical protein Smp_102490 [Schistosoma mansoni]
MTRPWAFNLMTSCRSLHVSLPHNAMSYTKESKPLPGSDEEKNPLRWAKRLFQLQESQPLLNQAKEPPLLHMVCRLKPLKGIIHYQRAILEKYGLGKDTKNHNWIVVKNTPSVNRDLYEIKHLIRIQPVIFENGLPTESDLLACRLLPDGRFFRHRGLSVDSQLLDSSGPNQVNLSTYNPNQSNDLKALLHSKEENFRYLSRTYLRKWHNKRWANHDFFKEFFTSHYKYKLNQDGNEYRYSGLSRLDKAITHSLESRRNPDGTLKQPNCNRFDADWNTYPWSRY